MLFDLRGRGRRRTIQVIYLSLALLMGLGLVLFGIGGATDGGLLNAFDSNSGGGQDNSKKIYEKQVKEAVAATRKRPRDPKAWGELTRTYVRGASANFDSNTRRYNAEGRAQLGKADRAWQKLQSVTDKPDPSIAAAMIQSYSEGGLNKPDKVVEAMEVMIDGREATTELYQQYAAYAYQAKQTRKGDLAAARAVRLAPKAQRKAVREQLKQLKEQIASGGAAAQDGGAAAPVG